MQVEKPSLPIRGDAMMVESTASVSPAGISRWFVNATDRDSGEATTHLKVQKLVYYAQAWYLANFDRPLFQEDMQAWTHGPVTPSVYDKYKGKGFDSLPPEGAVRLPDGLEPFLNAIKEQYGQFTAKHLEKMTHDEDPWRLTRAGLPLEARCTRPIDKLIIRNFYAARIGKKELKSLPH